MAPTRKDSGSRSENTYEPPVHHLHFGEFEIDVIGHVEIEIEGKRVRITVEPLIVVEGSVRVVSRPDPRFGLS